MSFIYIYLRKNQNNNKAQTSQEKTRPGAGVGVISALARAIKKLQSSQYTALVTIVTWVMQHHFSSNSGPNTLMRRLGLT
jgi:hypothetical protein